MRALLLCLFLAACAAPERHELRDGAPVRPAPVFVTPGYTPAGAGLPEYMPGPPEPVRVEPNPRPTRLLPQTPESRRGPGIWAGDATFDDVMQEFGVLGVLLPFPAGDSVEDAAMRGQVRMCAHIAREMFAAIMPENELAKATDADVICVVARAFRACALKDIARRDELKERGELYSPLINDLVERNRAAAQAFVDHACGPDSKTPWTARWTGEAMKNWDTYDKRKQ